jgi:tetratricopeptide (TPR) repeat protein
MASHQVPVSNFSPAASAYQPNPFSASGAAGSLPSGFSLSQQNKAPAIAQSNYGTQKNPGAVNCYPTQNTYTVGYAKAANGYPGIGFLHDKQEQISSLNRQAAQATAKRNFDEAINKLQEAQHLVPGDQIIGRNLGLAFGNAANAAVQGGDYKKALRYFQSALDILKVNSDRSAYDQICQDYQAMVKLQAARH